MLKFISHTNLFIAFAAVALTLGTGLQFGTIGNLLPYLLLVFWATLADYNWHRLIKLKMNIGTPSKNEWGYKHSSLIIFLGILSTIGLGISIFYVPVNVIIWMVVLGLITVFYSFPFHQLGWHWLDVRKIPGLKNLLISFTWTIITLSLPYMLATHSEKFVPMLLLFAERFLFILAITIPFDIKDVDEDLEAGWKTIPVLLGRSNALKITNIILVSMMFFSFMHLLNHGNNQGWAGIITGAYTLSILHSKKLRKHPMYYPLFVDGAIMILGLLLVAIEL